MEATDSEDRQIMSPVSVAGQCLRDLRDLRDQSPTYLTQFKPLLWRNRIVMSEKIFSLSETVKSGQC